MRKGNSPLINGIILIVAAAYLCWYFSAHSMWNAATVVVLIILVLLSLGQFTIWYMFFRDKNPKRKTGRK